MTAAAMTLDLIVVVACLAGASSFLIWRLGLRHTKSPCHATSNAQRGAEGSDGDVVVGAALARGLKRARERAATTRRAVRQK